MGLASASPSGSQPWRTQGFFMGFMVHRVHASPLNCQPAQEIAALTYRVEPNASRAIAAMA